MDVAAQAEVLVGAPPKRVRDVLTSPERRPEIRFGARTVTDWQAGHPTAQAAAPGSLPDGLRNIAEPTSGPR
ncbi:MAG TPA: hypothetical protein VGC04_09800 [Cellulomonas sp.]